MEDRLFDKKNAEELVPDLHVQVREKQQIQQKKRDKERINENYIGFFLLNKLKQRK